MDIGCIGAPFEVKFADGGSSLGAFEGYGAFFGNIDSYGDVIEPGAFKSSLTQRMATGRGLPPMYKMHGAMTGGRNEPVGIWDHMEEDSKGLAVKGRLCGMDTDQGKWNYALLRDGALKGLSIGFRVPPGGARKGSGKAGEPARYLKTINLREVSLVDDPANTMAQVSSFKSREIESGLAEYASEIKTIRDFEAFLRDVGGYSHTAAKALAAGGYKALPDPRDEDGIGAAIEEAMKRLASTIKS